MIDFKSLEVRGRGNTEYLLRAAVREPGVVFVCINRCHAAHLERRWFELVEEELGGASKGLIGDGPKFVSREDDLRRFVGSEVARWPIVVDLGVVGNISNM